MESSAATSLPASHSTDIRKVIRSENTSENDAGGAADNRGATAGLTWLPHQAAGAWVGLSRGKGHRGDLMCQESTEPRRVSKQTGLPKSTMSREDSREEASKHYFPSISLDP